MKLHHQIQGTGEPLLILHGLFGSLDNWGSQAKALADDYRVISIDLRNHGRSPHDNEMSYAAMAQDLVELMDNLGIDSALVLGHSMGGKAAMQLALTAPERVSKLIVVDIAPVQYPDHHSDVFSGLQSIDLATVTSRSDAEKQLSLRVDDAMVRAFLLRNLYRTEAGQFDWRFNLQALHSGYPNISAPPTGTPYTGPCLFIKGGDSEYIQASHRDAILELFPAAGYKVVEGTGHWPHAQKPALMTRLIRNFLQG
ncbi:alpha/beta fold hydrolase [Marinobacterium rhizophilum]|uniref:Alpha/beta fold hydrolase n=1 Tax=Marinobacterium rhizophilum TaxID=420402 RepID=A0ABY5HSI8_9GAMM|nr:alpha/beta fold hydrolase [Marinobacterium rhizophilum]UTW14164.1 alpha/beta fold hydrolase [Marinobacterium rhizophilum]